MKIPELKFHEVPENSHLDPILVRQVHEIVSKGDISSLDVHEVKVLHDEFEKIKSAGVGYNMRELHTKIKVAETFNFVCTHPHVSIAGLTYFTKLLTNAQINMTYKDYPKFLDFVQQYGELLRAGRAFKED